MQYELNYWDSLVTKAGHLWQGEPEDPGRIEAGRRETARVRDAWMRALLDGHPDPQLRRYVQAHQRGLVGIGEAAGPNPPAYLVAELDGLWDFLEQHFGEHLDLGLALPAYRTERVLTAVRDFLSRAEGRMASAGVDPSLSKVAMDLLVDFSVGTRPLTFARWYPIREFIGFLDALPVSAGPVSEETTTRVLDKLLHLNLNATPVYRYVKSNVLESISGQEYPLEQLPELARIRRYFTWVRQRPGYIFQEERGSILPILVAWLDELVRLKEAEARSLAEGGSSDLSGFGQDAKKVITSLTVSELGLIIRLFMETGVFRTRNRKGLSRFMAQNVVTLQKEAHEEFSSEHLYTAFYSPTEGTMDSVLAILNRMIARLGKIRVENRTRKPAKPEDTPGNKGRTAAGGRKPRQARK